MDLHLLYSLNHIKIWYQPRLDALHLIDFLNINISRNIKWSKCKIPQQINQFFKKCTELEQL